MAVHSDWFNVLHDAAPARGTIVCFHFGGGNAMAFRHWKEHLPSGVRLAGVDLPGRGMRFGEPLLEDIDAVIDGLLAASDWLESQRPFVFFGHSLGALMAWEFTRRLEAIGAPTPAHVVVAGRNALHLPRRSAPIHGLPDKEFIPALRRYDGTPEEVLANDELLELFLPVLRADFRISETYVHDAAATPPAVPLMALGGDEDGTVNPAQLDEWSCLTSSTFSSRRYAGGHFFINDHARDIVKTLAGLLDFPERHYA